jgi:hypothetical protein
MFPHLPSCRLWITVTCNPLWEEIQGALLPGQTAADRPDIVNRVFKEKLRAILAGLKSGLFFGGKSMFIMHVIEFQVRGGPHCDSPCPPT